MGTFAILFRETPHKAGGASAPPALCGAALIFRVHIDTTSELCYTIYNDTMSELNQEVLPMKKRIDTKLVLSPTHLQL